MKTVLLPTDFSKNAWNAIFTALKLFHNIQCKFLLFHTYEPELTNILGDHGEQRLGSIYESMEAESRKQMDHILKYLREHHQNPRHTFKVLIRPGDLIGEVRGRIKKSPVDMIVMGTQGATGAERVLLGSNTVRMLKGIKNRPVLAVPESYDFQRLDHVVFPTDYTRYYEPYELQPLLELLKSWKSTLHVAYAAREFKLKPSQESNMKLLETRLQDMKVRFEKVRLEKNLSQAISEFSDAVKADMIALVQYKHSFLENLTREKVVKRIAFDSKLPLLILPQVL
jgi:nucleotide-binding universal stress UspA family protein